MADAPRKTYPELTPNVTLEDGDLIATYRAPGPAGTIQAQALAEYVSEGIQPDIDEAVAAAAAATAAAAAAENAAAAAIAAASMAQTVPTPKCVWIGDSNWQFNHIVSGTGANLYTASRGLVVTAHGINPRFDINTWCDLAKPTPFINGANQGVSGETSAQILTRVSNTMVQNPDFVIVGPPTNDVRNNVAAATSLATYISIAQYCLDRGAKVIVGTIAPMSIAILPLTGTNRQNQADFNTGIAAWASGRANVYFVDYNALMDDGTAVLGGVPKAGWTDDGIHWTPLACQTMAPYLNTQINKIVLPSNAYPSFTTGNVFPNYNMIGSAGTVNGPAVTGVAPTGFRVRRLSGTSTAVASVTANATTGGQNAVLTITLAGVNESTFEYRLPTDTINTTAYIGQWVKMWVQITAVGDAFRNIAVNGDTPLGAERSQAASTDVLGTVNGTTVKESAPFLLGVTNTTITPSVSITVNPAGGGSPPVVTIRQWGFAVVADPRIARFLS